MLTCRSSHLSRTIQSTVQVFSGLYPNANRRAIPNFHLRLVNHENLYPNEDSCKYSSLFAYPKYSRLKRLMAEYSKKAAAEWDERLQLSSQHLRNWLPDGITVNGRPKANGLFDTILASLYSSLHLN